MPGQLRCCHGDNEADIVWQECAIVEAFEKMLLAGEAPLAVLAPQHKIHQSPGNGDDLRDLRIRGRGGLHAAASASAGTTQRP